MNIKLSELKKFISWAETNSTNIRMLRQDLLEKYDVNTHGETENYQEAESDLENELVVRLSDIGKLLRDISEEELREEKIISIVDKRIKQLGLIKNK